MELVNTLALYGTIIEIMLIIVIVLISVILKYLYTERQITKDIDRQDIELYILNKMKLRSQIVSSKFNDKWKELDLLLQIIADFDKYHSGMEWNLVRSNFIRNVILPLARKAALSSDWTIRQYAAHAFSLYSENSDGKHIINLINDGIPLVRYSAAKAGIIYGSEASFNSVIRQMSTESWLTQAMYMEGFNNIPSATHNFIERLLKSSSDSSMKATCYNLLLKYPVFIADWDISKDINSKDIKLALSAMRYLAFSQKDASIETLIKMTSHKDWRMRSIAISCLGDLNAQSALFYIKENLNDNDWWVRFAARQTMQKFGSHGSEVLLSKNINNNEINIDISQQILNTF